MIFVVENVVKKFWSKKILGQKFFGSKTFLGQKNFGSKNFLGPTKICAWKKFGSEKILGPKNFVVVLVLLVTWTPNPLNSAKSP